MIETKEQYEAFKKDIEGASSYRASTNSEFSAGDLLETIEALRKVVGAAREWADMRGRPVYATERELMAALDAIPDWLKGE